MVDRLDFRALKIVGQETFLKGSEDEYTVYTLDLNGGTFEVSVDHWDTWVQCNHVVAPYYLRGSIEEGNPNMVGDPINLVIEEKDCDWRYTSTYMGDSFYFEPAFDDAVEAVVSGGFPIIQSRYIQGWRPGDAEEYSQRTFFNGKDYFKIRCKA